MRFYYLIPLLVSWTVTVLALRMRKPRPRMTRLMAQPGAVACMTVLACITLQAAELAIHAVREQSDFDYNFYGVRVLIVAYAVGSSWITLLVGGRWRAEPGWIDRLGRLLGLVWIFPLLLGMIAVTFS